MRNINKSVPRTNPHRALALTISQKNEKREGTLGTYGPKQTSTPAGAIILRVGDNFIVAFPTFRKAASEGARQQVVDLTDFESLGKANAER